MVRGAETRAQLIRPQSFRRRVCAGGPVLLALCLGLCLGFAARAGVQALPAEQIYRVGRFTVSFDEEIRVHPTEASVLARQIRLARSDAGFIARSQGGQAVRLALNAVPGQIEQRFSGAALTEILVQLTDEFRRAGYSNAVARFSPDDLAADGRDLRAADNAVLRIQIATEGPRGIEAVGPDRSVRPVPVQEMPSVDRPRPPTAGIIRRSMGYPIVKPGPLDGRRFEVSQIVLEYAEQHPQHPSLELAMDQVGVHLLEAPDGFVGAPPRKYEMARFVKLNEIPYLNKHALYASAIQQITSRLLQYYVDLGYIGITVVPHPEDVSGVDDVRPAEQKTLRLVIRIGRATEIRTVASGERIRPEDRINHRSHERIIRHSPIQLAGDPNDPNRKDLLRKDKLDDYIARLNRHPGRRVSVALSPATEPGGAAMDFLVTENKPWTLYAQISNTGTESTSEWRQRFGVVHNQLTGRDDIFSLDYITGDFDAAHALFGTYEAPFFDSQRLRWRAEGFWSEFTASDVGFAREAFEGDEWYAGGDLILNVFQQKELFIDVLVGAQYQQDRVENVTLGGSGGLVAGDQTFLLPRVGLELERFTETAATQLMLSYEINVSNVDTAAEDMGLEAFGRDLSDEGEFAGNEHFSRLTFDASQSLYLEPILYGQGWLDPTTPGTSTLAHEVYVGVKGQWSPDRNIPQFERTVGGLYSVRGYDESIVAGDSVYIVNLEYRYHVPRAFAIQPTPGTLFGKPFRWAPQQVYGRPDWDLILRGFFDYAQTVNNRSEIAATGLEDDYDLMSTGVGFELMFKRNVSIRMDWGFALEGVSDRADAGDDRLHIVATFLY